MRLGTGPSSPFFDEDKDIAKDKRDIFKKECLA